MIDVDGDDSGKNDVKKRNDVMERRGTSVKHNSSPVPALYS